MRAATAVDAAGKIPAQKPGFERCSRLHRKRQHLQTTQPILTAILHALYTPVI
jgi:hypothetical protein